MLIPLLQLPRSKALQTADKDDELKVFIKQLGYLGPVLLKRQNVIDSNIPLPCERVSELAECSLDGFLPSDSEQAAKLLDMGMHVIYFSHVAEEERSTMTELSTLPKNRVGLSAFNEIPTSNFIEDTIQVYSPVAENFIFELTADMSAEAALDLMRRSKITASNRHVQICFIVPKYTISELVMMSSISENIHIIFEPCLRLLSNAPPSAPSLPLPSSSSSTSSALSPSLSSPLSPLSLSLPPSHIASSPYSRHLARAVEDSSLDGHIEFLEVYIGRIKTDRLDGLYTTVVCDEQGVCLGLVYSNAESIRTAVTVGKGVFWSRSRGGLWIKGETSGMWQELIKIDLDCDADALRFTVKQKGDPPSFCHLMTRSCWGEPRGLQRLEALLRDRKKQAPEGSYTKRLFEDPTLLRKKLLEEVQELVEATDPDHIAAEAADVLYFALTRCVSAGVGISDIEAHLDKRSMKVTRRPGNAKDWRTKAAEEELAGKKS